MNILSFRAECSHDVKILKEELIKAQIGSVLFTHPDVGFPDVEIEMQTSGDIETIRSLMRNVDDGHVMVSTLRQCPLKDNPLTRDAAPE